MTLQLPPLSLYIHVPWCIKKCPYCDFNSHAVRDDIPEAAYIDSLLEDLRSEQALAQGREITTIFIGGGTPSLFSPDSYALLLQQIDRIIPIQTGAEITLEANPGTFEQEKFKGYRAAGINRLSLGIQSFNSSHLAALGRVHNGTEAIQAATFAREQFDNINLDLMHGLPGQSQDDAQRDLQQAIQLEPDHLSWYQLTIEPNTEFHAKPPTLPIDETLWGIQEAGQALLASAGFQQYEISAYARPQRQAQHNLNYWHFGDYLGIGAGAHGKITQAENGQIIRRWKQKQPKRFMQSDTRLAGEQAIQADELAFEFMLNALRLHNGVETELLAERTGLLLQSLLSKLTAAEQKGLLEPFAQRIKPTPQGRLFLNDLLELFLD